VLCSTIAKQVLVKGLLGSVKRAKNGVNYQYKSGAESLLAARTELDSALPSELNARDILLQPSSPLAASSTPSARSPLTSAASTSVSVTKSVKKLIKIGYQEDN